MGVFSHCAFLAQHFWIKTKFSKNFPTAQDLEVAIGCDTGMLLAEINMMWAGHQAHHSSEDYNFTTALRQGVFQRYSSWVSFFSRD